MYTKTQKTCKNTHTQAKDTMHASWEIMCKRICQLLHIKHYNTLDKKKSKNCGEDGDEIQIMGYSELD